MPWARRCTARGKEGEGRKERRVLRSNPLSVFPFCLQKTGHPVPEFAILGKISRTCSDPRTAWRLLHKVCAYYDSVLRILLHAVIVSHASRRTARHHAHAPRRHSPLTRAAVTMQADDRLQAVLQQSASNRLARQCLLWSELRAIVPWVMNSIMISSRVAHQRSRQRPHTHGG